MSNQTLHVVGDKFSGFHEANPDVISASHLEQMLARQAVPSDLLLVVGQGLQDDRLRRLQVAFEAYAPKNTYLETDRAALSRAPGDASHKHFARNTLISTPEKTSDPETFKASLLIDDSCADLSDHVTGQHVQGMVFVEAARQMFLAVSEEHHLEEATTSKHYFVIKKMNVDFHSFAFPLRTSIQYNVISLKRGKRGTLTSEVMVTFRQGDVVVADVEIAFAAYESAFLAAREAVLARKALDHAAPMAIVKAG
jgi:acyl-CoA thioesterase FadM